VGICKRFIKKRDQATGEENKDKSKYSVKTLPQSTRGIVTQRGTQTHLLKADRFPLEIFA
jgi:hypothetical protein